MPPKFQLPRFCRTQIHRFTAILTLLVLIGFATLHSQTNYFVAKTGDNNNPGTEAQPS